jgi:D-beta-D-heptose 7-phosphate kinase / D-beta-D-heptose 1-phosphate adenosyltransferase
MSYQLEPVIDSFSDLRVLVFGEAMLDTYLQGSTRRLCQEAPVPIVDVRQRRDVPGGAANTAVNVCSLGAEAILLSVVGDDCEGRMLRDVLSRRRVDVEHLLVSADRQTLSKHRVLADGQLVVRYDQGTTSAMDAAVERRFIQRLRAIAPRCDAVIVSDYRYGILTPAVIAALGDLKTRHRKLLLVDSKRLPEFRPARPTVVKPNYPEAMQLLNSEPANCPSERAESVLACGEEILDVTGAQIAAVTLDTEGALIFERGAATYRTYAQPHRQAQVAGAGIPLWRRSR